jgi:hypothetical protein
VAPSPWTALAAASTPPPPPAPAAATAPSPWTALAAASTPAPAAAGAGVSTGAGAGAFSPWTALAAASSSATAATSGADDADDADDKTPAASASAGARGAIAGFAAVHSALDSALGAALAPLLKDGSLRTGGADPDVDADAAEDDEAADADADADAVGPGGRVRVASLLGGSDDEDASGLPSLPVPGGSVRAGDGNAFAAEDDSNDGFAAMVSSLAGPATPRPRAHPGAGADLTSAGSGDAAERVCDDARAAFARLAGAVLRRIDEWSAGTTEKKKKKHNDPPLDSDVYLTAVLSIAPS